MTVNASVQFNSFVDFAQKSMEAGSSKAVARADTVVPGVDGGFATRTIVAAPDKAFKLSRSITDKAKNDVARTLFQKSVIEMFGGEDRIPKSVKDAMLLKDYGEGKPLTARRIMAVKEAIDQSLAKSAVADGLRRVNEFQRASEGTISSSPPIVLTDDQMSMAADLVEKHGKGLSEKGVKLLSNFTVTLFSCGKPADMSWDACVEKYARDVSKWCDFPPDDPRFAAVNAKMTEHARSVLDEYLSDTPKFNKQFDGEGLHQSFCKDASRASFFINGQDMSHGTVTGDAVIEAFKQAVPREHRRAISSFFSQTTGSAMIGMSQQRSLFSTAGLPQGIDLSKVEGSQMLISSAFGYDDPFYQIPKTQINDSVYTLDVASDGRSAKVTVETKGDIFFAVVPGNNVIGSFAWKQEYEFDLTGDRPQIVSARVGQTFEA